MLEVLRCFLFHDSFPLNRDNPLFLKPLIFAVLLPFKLFLVELWRLYSKVREKQKIKKKPG